jgi:hypothetical protein
MDTVEEPDTTSHLRKIKFIKSEKIRKGSRFLNKHEIQMMNTLIALFKKAREEDENLKKSFGLDGWRDFFDEKNREAEAKYDSAPKPNEEAFNSFLETLLDNELALVEAVMYGGRDALSTGRAYPLDEMLPHFEKDSREDRMCSITEKISFDEYLSAGIEAYRETEE